MLGESWATYLHMHTTSSIRQLGYGPNPIGEDVMEFFRPIGIMGYDDNGSDRIEELVYPAEGEGVRR